MLNGTTPEIQHRIWGLCGSPNVHVFYCIALTEICSSQDLYIMTLVCMNLSVTYYIFSWTIFDNRKELPRASRVPNSQQDIWALFELIFCLPIQIDFREDFSTFIFFSLHQLVSKCQIWITKRFCLIQKKIQPARLTRLISSWKHINW